MVPAVNKKDVVKAYPTYRYIGGSACGLPQTDTVASAQQGVISITSRWKSASQSTNPVGPTGYREVTNWSAGRYNFGCDPIRAERSAGLSCMGASYKFRYQSGFFAGVDNPSGPGPFTVIPPTELDVSVRNALLKRISGLTGTELGLAFLERKQTEDLFVSTVRSISRSATGIKRMLRPESWNRFVNGSSSRSLRGTQLYRRNKRKSDARFYDRHGRDVSRRVLEIQYGWRPLIGDLQAASATVDFRQQNEGYRLSKKARSVIVNTGVTSTPAEYWGVSAFNYSYSTSWECKYKAWFRLKTGTLPTLASAGLANPLSLVWNRIPFSFIVDWFYTLGPWLATFDIGLMFEFLDGARSSKATWSSQPMPPTLPADYYLLGGGTAYSNGMAFTRLKLGAFPSGQPAWRNPCNPQHVLNSLALLGQLIGGGRNVPRPRNRP